MKQTITTTTEKYPSAMYEMVFESRYVKMAVLLLFGFLLLQPVSLAFADEVQEEPAQAEEAPVPAEEVEEAEPAVEPVATEEEVIEEEVAEEEEISIQEDAAAEAVAETAIEEGTDEAAIENEEEPLPPVAPEEEVITDETASTTDAAQEQEPVLEEETGSNDEEQSESSEEEDASDSSQEAVEEEVIEEETIGTSTDESVLIVDHNSSAYEFDTKECTSVGEGAFYCSSTEDSDTFLQDGVFAAPDSDGDLEIFVRLNGEESIITSNTIDDSAPYYDALSERIVWHANINDRYQIMSYEISSGEHTQLTSASYNNMEPVAFGDITLWQAWVNNNWEIVMADGDEQTQLTSNTVHDVSPHMRGEYVVWQTQFAEGWKVAVYDQDSERIEYVDAEGGTKIENPRFVLVYDSTNEAGDIQTVGYDLDNKKSFTLNSIPAQLPDELPEPDQTGETRALIQNKHSVKGSEIEELEPVPTGNSTSTQATSTESNGVPTLDLTSSSSSTASSSELVIPDATELIVTAYQPAIENEEISHIPDILIPPLEATSTAEVR